MSDAERAEWVAILERILALLKNLDARVKDLEGRMGP